MPHSKAFIAAVWATIGGIVGTAVGGYGIDLAFLTRPDFELPTLVAMAVGGTLGWCLGLIGAWRIADRNRPRTSRIDVTLFVLGAMVVLWLGSSSAGGIRRAEFGPMIDGIGPHHRTLPAIATTHVVAATIIAFTLVVLALTRLRTARRPC